MKKALVFAIVLMLTASAFVLAEPQPGPAGPDGDEGFGPAMGEGIFKVIDELKLTTEEEQKLTQMRDASKREIFALRNEIKTSLWDIQDEIKKDTSDRSKINSLTDKISDDQKKLMKLRTEEMFKVKEILTPEQFKKLLTELEKHKRKLGKKIMKNTKEK